MLTGRASLRPSAAVQKPSPVFTLVEPLILMAFHQQAQVCSNLSIFERWLPARKLSAELDLWSKQIFNLGALRWRRRVLVGRMPRRSWRPAAGQAMHFAERVNDPQHGGSGFGQ